jgi:hypothetical protein
MNINLNDKHARGAIGGSLRSADPRRFVVEAMLGAMQADGVVDARELAVLDRHLAEHDLFQGVRPDAARTLIELAADALRFAGASAARIGAIARGLPSRIHRGTAYAMACEVVQADEDVTHAELAYLEALRHHLRVGPDEARAVFDALRERRLGTYLDTQVAHVRSLASVTLELLALRASAAGAADITAELRNWSHAHPDLALSPELLPSVIDGALCSVARELPLHDALADLARRVPAMVDRWWLAVYAHAAEAAPWGWRSSRFLLMLQYAFGLPDADMNVAAEDAAMQPRP